MNGLTRSIILAAAAALAWTIGLGCEERPDVPQAVLDQANKPKEAAGPTRPTTQQLLSGRRTRLQLTPLPLTMELPDGWTQGEFEGVKNPGNLLNGYTPNGVVQVDLGSRPSMKPDRLDQIMEGARKEMAKTPNLKVELRPLGDLKVLERQKVLPEKELKTYAIDGSRMVEKPSIESPFNWSLTVLVPHEGAYQVYELNFLGLTRSQYDKDKEFLDGIVNTLRYAGDTGGGSSSVAPPAPPASPVTPGTAPAAP